MPLPSLAKLSLVSCRYGNVVEDYLDVYLRSPDLPKDDITRALVARGRARKGAGQKLLLMASRGQCHLPLYCLRGRILLTTPSLPFNFAYDASQTSRRPRHSTLQTENSGSTGAASPLSVLPFLPPISPFMSLFLPPGPLFRRSRIPTRSAGNLGPDRKLYTTVLPPHVALRILLPSRHRPPSHLPHSRPIPL